MQLLHDEIATLQLEIGQIEKRNQSLSKDNATLLQRWLDAKQTEVNKMNEANDFYEDMRTRHQANANSRDGSDTTGTGSDPHVSGNGTARAEDVGAGTRNGTTSSGQKGVSLTPNG